MQHALCTIRAENSYILRKCAAAKMWATVAYAAVAATTRSAGPRVRAMPQWVTACRSLQAKPASTAALLTHGIVRFGPSNAAVPPRTTGLGTRGIRYSVRCDRSSSHCCDSVAIEGAPARDELVAHHTQLIVGRERCFNLHAPMCCAS